MSPAALLPAPSSRLQQDAMSEAYTDLRRVVYKMAHKFSQRDRVPFDELLSVANYYFVEACRTYNPGEFKRKKVGKPNRAYLITYVYFVLHCRLSSYLKKNHKHRFHAELKEEMFYNEATCDFTQRVHDSLTNDDARHVVDLVVNSCSDLQVMFRWQEVTEPKQVLPVLKEHLEDLGWSAKRIAESFKEIRQVLAQ